jgi:DNA-binding MarR family transcriptional regulator
MTALALHARTINRLLAERHARALSMPAGLFGEPCYDMLLDLAAHDSKGHQVSITSACVASHAPPTTALRYIETLEGVGMVERRQDPLDGRRRYLLLTDTGTRQLGRFFQRVEARHG